MILKSLNHENIVKFINSVRDPDGNLWIVMEFMDAGTLFGYVMGNADKGKHLFEEPELWVILCDLASALDYLHSQPKPVTHSDITPLNVLGIEVSDLT